MPALEQCKDEEGSQSEPANYWGVRFTIHDSLSFLATMGTKASLVLQELTSGIMLPLEGPNCIDYVTRFGFVNICFFDKLPVFSMVEIFDLRLLSFA